MQSCTFGTVEQLSMNCTASTPACGAWCALAAASTPCWYPNASQCSGDLCCLSCTAWERWGAPQVPSCSCADYKAGVCWAKDCVPCSEGCFYHNASGPPLGNGILCTNNSATECEPCFQFKHTHTFGHLLCPCDGDGADCPPSGVGHEDGSGHKYDDIDR